MNVYNATILYDSMTICVYMFYIIMQIYTKYVCLQWYIYTRIYVYMNSFTPAHIEFVRKAWFHMVESSVLAVCLGPYIVH